MNICYEISLWYGKNITWKYGSIFCDKIRETPRKFDNFKCRTKIATVCCYVCCCYHCIIFDCIENISKLFRWTFSLDFKYSFQNKHQTCERCSCFLPQLSLASTFVIFAFVCQCVFIKRTFIHYEFVRPKQLIGLSCCRSKRDT